MKNIGKYEERCIKLKAGYLEIQDVTIQTQIKDEMIKEFQSLTPEEGREMVRASSVLLLPNWDIEYALILNYVSNKLKTLEKNKEEILGAKFSIDQVSLIIWSIRKEYRTLSLQLHSIGQIGNLIVKRVEDTISIEVVYIRCLC